MFNCIKGLKELDSHFYLHKQTYIRKKSEKVQKYFIEELLLYKKCENEYFHGKNGFVPKNVEKIFGLTKIALCE
jgi:hypothetical protein